jgi:hypothetical protein|tara:strand:+ start:68 stop:550 length:483 start_codon:yes stop_codon:yes gene_type:complete
MEKEQNNAVPSSSANGSADTVVGDEGVAADISARDEYNPNWSKQQKKTPSVYTGGSARALPSTYESGNVVNAHKRLQVALDDIIQETLQDVVQQTVQDALDSYDFGDWVTSALDNYDFDSIVSEVIDNHNFDDIVGEAMEDRFGELFRQHVKRLYINCER